MNPIDRLKQKRKEDLKNKVYTIGELVEIAEAEKISLSDLVVCEAMLKENKTYEDVTGHIWAAFEHNFKGLEVGLAHGKSFLLGTVGSDLSKCEGNVLIDDSLINKALIYTLATEVGNHEIGLRPCAGTGDSCPYTGLLRALKEENYNQKDLERTAALILKVGSVFRAGKQTTGCNMEGYGAGAAATAAALTDLRGGTPTQVARAMVLALSPFESRREFPPVATTSPKLKAEIIKKFPELFPVRVC